MSDREERLRALLNKVRNQRPGERTTRAADALDRIRTASGTTEAVQSRSAVPERVPSSTPARAHSSAPVTVHSSAPPTVPPTPAPSSFPTQLPTSPLPEPPTSPTLESPTRYSSQPPRVERPLSVEPRARSVGSSSGAPSGASSDPPASQSQSRRPEPIRPQSVAPTGQPVLYATDPPEFPRPKTFGDLLELTLSLRPR
jgi:hypothetical protein